MCAYTFRQNSYLKKKKNHENPFLFNMTSK